MFAELGDEGQDLVVRLFRSLTSHGVRIVWVDTPWLASAGIDDQPRARGPLRHSGRVVIRVRRLSSGRFRRRRYEVHFIPDPSREPEWARITSSPVTLIDRYLGVADAWSVIHAADEAWDGRLGEWVTFPPPSSSS